MKKSSGSLKYKGIISNVIYVFLLMIALAAIVSSLVNKEIIAEERIMVACRLCLFAAVGLGLIINNRNKKKMAYYLLSGMIIMTILLLAEVLLIGPEELNYCMPIIITIASLLDYTLINRTHTVGKSVRHRMYRR